MRMILVKILQVRMTVHATRIAVATTRPPGCKVRSGPPTAPCREVPIAEAVSARTSNIVQSSNRDGPRRRILPLRRAVASAHQRAGSLPDDHPGSTAGGPPGGRGTRSTVHGTWGRTGPERWTSIAVLVCLCDLILTYVARSRYSLGWYGGRGPVELGVLPRDVGDEGWLAVNDGPPCGGGKRRINHTGKKGL